MTLLNIKDSWEMSGSADKILIDTNILIYLTQNKLRLSDFSNISDDIFISSITYIEALGFSFQDKWEEELAYKVCATFRRLFLTEEIEKQTILIRKSHKIKLPDAIIAATAIVHNLTLVTRNESDFKNIVGLRVLNPF